MHIRVEQQMRLHIENLQQKIEDLERDYEYAFKKAKAELIEVKAERNKLKEQIGSKDDELHKKEAECKNKYNSKIKAVEHHYEKLIQKLVEELNLSKCSKIMKSEGTKSSNDIK